MGESDPPLKPALELVDSGEIPIGDLEPAGSVNLDAALASEELPDDEAEALRNSLLSSRGRMLGHIPFDEPEERMLVSLAVWMGACGALFAIFGVGSLLRFGLATRFAGELVVGIFSSALGFWLLSAGWRFRQVAVTDGKDQHHLINGFGLLRTALLFKALILFVGMVLGCFVFSLIGSFLFLL
jgi:hypothetical protein